MRSRHGASLIATFIVALIWGTAAVAKAVAPPDSESWLVTVSSEVQYSITLGEAVAAAAILAGFRRTGLAIGLTLLLGFAGALSVSPPAPGQSCGCLGALAVNSAPRDIAAHLFAFAALHVFAASLLLGKLWTCLPAPGDHGNRRDAELALHLPRFSATTAYHSTS